MMNLYAKFSDLHLAERAVAALLDHGVSKADISLVGPPVAGAAEGDGIGLLIPGFGLMMGGGALATAAAAAAGTSAGGAVAGGVAGFLHDQGLDASAAHAFARAIEAGGAIVEVCAPSGDVAPEAIYHLLAKYGADLVSEVRAEAA